jgi:hypothetical protein
MSHRDTFVKTNVKKSWESDSKWSISHPPISPEANFLTIFNVVFSSQLKEMLNFINITPELGASLAGSSKYVICVKVLGLQKFEPEGIMFNRVRQSPDPFCHEGNIQKSGVDNPEAPLDLWPAHFRPIHPVKFSFFTNSFPEESS